MADQIITEKKGTVLVTDPKIFSNNEKAVIGTALVLAALAATYVGLHVFHLISF